MALVADDVREELTPQQLLQYEAMQAPDPLRASLFECRVAAQVAYLASQHHVSDYNRLKFGANGAPGLYVPLSIQLPSHARDMRMYQAMTAEKQLWWSADRLSTLHHHAHPILEARTGNPDASQDTARDLLQLELDLSNAIASHIPQPPPATTLLCAAPAANNRVAPITKTSESHPINMSAVIPYDLLPAISAYFFTTKQQQQSCVQPPPTPTVLHLPRQLRLDCLMPVSVLPVPVPVPQMQAPAAAAPVVVVASPRTRRSASAFSHSHPHHPPHPALVIPPAALRADLTTDDPTPPPLAPGQIIPLALAPAPAPAPLAPTHVPLPPSPVDNTRSDESETKISQLLLSSTSTSTTAKPSKEVLEAIEEAASSALPIPISISILPPSPPPLPPSSVVLQHDRRSTAPLQPLTNGIIHHKHGNGNGNEVSAKGRSGSVNSVFVKGTPTHPILNGVPSTPFPTDREFATPPPLPTHGNGNGSRNRHRPMVVHGPLIGNLLLSSCPGKKVRLNGPVKGRGTIYRNLGLDMQRMKDAGVRCLVCCLDDSELQFLGAPWEEYARAASVVGLDVLRIPTPEGFAPLAPGMLNDQLDFLIQKYTLQGQNMLVHCRGGVGRAGLVACCWMLKMGLCGWTQEAQLHGQHVPTNGVDLPQPPPVKTPAEVFSKCTNGQTPSPAPAPAPISSDHSALSHPAATTDENSRPHLTRPGTPVLSTLSAAAAPAAAPASPIQWNTVDLVERVVRVVRWRRSVKAIETYEQVRFLVEFVEFLRGGCVPTPEVEVEGEIEVEVKAVDPNPNPNPGPGPGPNPDVVVNGYANSVPVLDEIKVNGVIADDGIPLVMKARGDEGVQET